MKKKTKKANSKTIYSIINDFKIFLQENQETLPNEESKEKSNQLIIESDQVIRKAKEEAKGSLIISIFFMCLFGGLMYFSFINMDEIDNLKNDIYQKNLIIDRLQRSDSLYHKFMDDRGNGISYWLKSDTTVMTYRDLMAEEDSIRTEYYKQRNINSELRGDISLMEWKLSYIKERYGIYIIEKDGYYTFSSSVVDTALRMYPHFKENVEFLSGDTMAITKIDTRNLESKFKELTEELSKEKIHSSIYKSILKNYDIKINISENNNSYTYTTESLKLDSALLLLDAYRDEMKYDEKKTKWDINGGKVEVKIVSSKK